MSGVLIDTDDKGYFGEYGGSFIPEILSETLSELKNEFEKIKGSEKFWKQYVELMQTYSCRPTSLTPLSSLSEHLGGLNVLCKREDLNHTGAHKINNVMGQGLLAKSMGKARVIAETGAGQHGVATATMAAKMGFECTIYMGALDVERQRPNVFWMEKLGAKVVSIKDGTQTLKDAINAALRDWSGSMENTHYVLGTACGPHPFPQMVAYFQSIIGIEARKQILNQAGTLPKSIYACVGGGSNALGIFSGFLEDTVELIGVEAGGRGISTNNHAARFQTGSDGVAQGYKTLFLQDSQGQMLQTHSIAAGLDYIGVSPILSDMAQKNKARFIYAKDNQVVEAAKLLIKTEGIIPALESVHAFAGLIKEKDKYKKGDTVLVNLSGRGDKDIFNYISAFEDKSFKAFLKLKSEE